MVEMKSLDEKLQEPPDPYLSYYCGYGKDGQRFNATTHASCRDEGCECECHPNVTIKLNDKALV